MEISIFFSPDGNSYSKTEVRRLTPRLIFSPSGHNISSRDGLFQKMSVGRVMIHG